MIIDHRLVDYNWIYVDKYNPNKITPIHRMGKPSRRHENKKNNNNSKTIEQKNTYNIDPKDKSESTNKMGQCLDFYI